MPNIKMPEVFVINQQKRKDSFLVLNAGGLYRLIGSIDYYGFGSVPRKHNGENINLELGELLLFTGKCETKPYSYGHHDFADTGTRYYFINRTSLIYVRDGWITTKYLEQINLCNKNNLTKQTQEIT